MKPSLTCAKLKVKKSSIHGYGVFAEEDIYPGQVVEECYILKSEEADPGLADYYFECHGDYVVCFGYGCIYNHSDQPNVSYIHHPGSAVLTFIANKLIKQGDEIFISYGETWFAERHVQTQQSTLWFKLCLIISKSQSFIRFLIVFSALLGLLKISSLLTVKIL